MTILANALDFGQATDGQPDQAGSIKIQLHREFLKHSHLLHAHTHGNDLLVGHMQSIRSNSYNKPQLSLYVAFTALQLSCD